MKKKQEQLLKAREEKVTFNRKEYTAIINSDCDFFYSLPSSKPNGNGIKYNKSLKKTSLEKYAQVP